MQLDHAYWEQRWQEGRTGWDQEAASASLEHVWKKLDLSGNERVFVPFCGKSVDMLWLASQGHKVLGVEISRLAIDRFFEENNLQRRTEEHVDGTHHSAGAITIVECDIYAIDQQTLATCGAFYDRGALVAQDADQRADYISRVYPALPSGCNGLLLTLDYPQAQRAGPPFAVSPAEIEARFSPCWQINCLVNKDALADNPGFQEAGVDYLNAAAHQLIRR